MRDVCAMVALARPTNDLDVNVDVNDLDDLAFSNDLE